MSLAVWPVLSLGTMFRSLIKQYTNHIADIRRNNQNTTFSGVLDESLASPSTGVSLIKVGTGTTFLADGNSNFSGGIIVNAGLLEIEAGGSLGLATNLVTINDGGGIWYNQSGAATFGVNRSFALGGGNDYFQVAL